MLKFLSRLVPIERSFFMVPRLAAIIAGFWPAPQRSWLTVLRFAVNTFAVALGAIGETLYGFVYLHNLSAALEAFCPGTTKIVSLLKMLIFFVYRKNWLAIVRRMRAFTINEATTAEKRLIVEQLASVASIFSFLVLAFGSLTNTFFNIRPLVVIAYRKWIGEPVETLLPFNVALPEVFVNYPWYPLTYCSLTLSGAMTVFTFSAVDGFFVCACMYMCGMFRMLQHDVHQLFAELRDCETATFEQNAKIRSELGRLVSRHNAIIDLCSDFTAQFTLIILMHFLSAALVLCLAILDLLMNTASFGILVYIFYSIAALTQLFLYCIGGSYVIESSLEFSDAVYQTEWYKCDTITHKMILMILQRAQRAKTVAVPFFTPSLPAFSSIISTAGSYITMLKTFL